MSRPDSNFFGQPVSSTALKVPMNDLTHEGLVAENNLLHRRVLMLTNLEVRLRAALELATGTSWDSENIADLSGDKLDEVVARNLAHGLRLSMPEARERVRMNKRLANPTQVEVPEGETLKVKEQPEEKPKEKPRVPKEDIRPARKTIVGPGL